MKQDQMSMAASIESRVPFLDYRLVEFSSSIPAKYSIKGLGGKDILKSAAEDLLPKSVVHRTKMGFPTPWAPLDGGILTHWMMWSADLLNSRSLDRGLTETEAIQHLFTASTVPAVATTAIGFGGC